VIVFTVVGFDHENYPQDEAEDAEDDREKPADEGNPADDGAGEGEGAEGDEGLGGVKAHPPVFLFEDKEDDAGDPDAEVAEESGDVWRESGGGFRGGFAFAFKLFTGFNAGFFFLVDFPAFFR